MGDNSRSSTITAPTISLMLQRIQSKRRLALFLAPPPPLGPVSSHSLFFPLPFSLSLSLSLSLFLGPHTSLPAISTEQERIRDETSVADHQGTEELRRTMCSA